MASAMLQVPQYPDKTRTQDLLLGGKCFGHTEYWDVDEESKEPETGLEKEERSSSDTYPFPVQLDLPNIRLKDRSDEIIELEEEEVVEEEEEEAAEEVERGHRVSLQDGVCPEDSIQAIVSDNDFYKFVLFKTHFNKYMNVSKLYEKAYLSARHFQQRYEELKAEHEALLSKKARLEKELQEKESQLQQKDDELFATMEKLAKMEDDGEKLKHDKMSYKKAKEVLEGEKTQILTEFEGVKAERDSIVQNCETLKKQTKHSEEKHTTLKRKSQYLQNEMRVAERKVKELELQVEEAFFLQTLYSSGLQHLLRCCQKRCRVCHYIRKNFRGRKLGNSRKLQQRMSQLRRWMNGMWNWIRPMPLHTSKHGIGSDSGGSYPELPAVVASRKSMNLDISSVPSFLTYQSTPKVRRREQLERTSPQPHLSPLDHLALNGSDDVSYIDESPVECNVVLPHSNIPSTGSFNIAPLSPIRFVSSSPPLDNIPPLTAKAIPSPGPVSSQSEFQSCRGPQATGIVKTPATVDHVPQSPGSGDSGFGSRTSSTERAENDKIQGSGDVGRLSEDGSSDSGVVIEKGSRIQGNKLRRNSWTVSFRKLFTRVSKRFNRV